MGLGIPGLIISVLISNLVAVATGLYLASRNFQAEIDLKAALSILVSSVLAFLAILPLETSRLNDIVLLALEVIVFLGVYLTAAPLLRAIGPEDIEFLDSAMAGLGRFRSVTVPILDYERFILRRSRGRR